jgi:hypothetical protein
MHRALATTLVAVLCGGNAGGLVALLVDALPFGWDVLVMAAFSIAIYALAVRMRLPGEAVEQRVGDLAVAAQEIEATLAPAR